VSLHREDLDALTNRCSVPGCTRTRHDGEIWLHSRCHPSAPTWACYRGGRLRIECARCKRPIATIKVARRRGRTLPIATDDPRGGGTPGSTRAADDPDLLDDLDLDVDPDEVLDEDVDEPTSRDDDAGREEADPVG
jgi:hypothetical protein